MSLNRPVGSRFKPVRPGGVDMGVVIAKFFLYSNHKPYFTMKRVTPKVQNSICRHQSYTKLDKKECLHEIKIDEAWEIVLGELAKNVYPVLIISNKLT